MNFWMEKLDSHLRVRLRMCIWKQWKTPRNRTKQLRKCGLPEWQCKAYGNSRKGYARIAKSGFMTRAIPKSTFDNAGLVSLLEYYLKQHITLNF